MGCEGGRFGGGLKDAEKTSGRFGPGQLFNHASHNVVKGRSTDKLRISLASFHPPTADPKCVVPFSSSIFKASHRPIMPVLG